MLLGGGGYTIRNVARCWTYETAVALGTEIANELPYNDYFEYFGPDFKLHISPSNMTNQNTPEYMDKIKTRLFENLRMLPHAPGVQMASIPEDGVTLKEESEAADEADPDKRNPPELKDKQIEPDNEFDGRPGKSGKKSETFFLNWYISDKTDWSSDWNFSWKLIRILLWKVDGLGYLFIKVEIV